MGGSVKLSIDLTQTEYVHLFLQQATQKKYRAKAKLPHIFLYWYLFRLKNTFGIGLLAIPEKAQNWGQGGELTIYPPELFNLSLYPA